MPPLQPPNPQLPNPLSASEPLAATDDPRSRKSAPKSFALAPALKPRISPYWMPEATRAYKAIRATLPIELADGTHADWPATNTLTAAMRAALHQAFGATAPNALHNPPLHSALWGQVEAHKNQNYGFEIQVGVFDDATIQSGNLQYRGKDKPTDVLSFSPWEGFEFPTMPDDPMIMLGDVVISIETAARQARELQHDLRAELAFLAVHGALHLLGYDHGNDGERRKMFALQDEIVARVREAKTF